MVFVNKVLEQEYKSEALRIIRDQNSNPTWVRDLADATFSLVSARSDNLQDVMKEYAAFGIWPRMEMPPATHG